MRPPKHSWRAQWKSLSREKKVLAAVYTLLRYSVIAVLIAQVFNRDFESVFLCVLTLFLFLLPSFFERRLHIDVPGHSGNHHSIVYLCR